MLLDTFIVDTLGGTLNDPDVNAMCVCPSCGKDDHFGIRRDNGLGHCFKCGYNTNLLKLFRDITGVSSAVARKKVATLIKGTKVHTSKDEDDWDLAVVTALFEQEEVDMKRQEFFPPKGIVDIKSRKAYQARKYLRGRGFRNAHISQYELWYGVKYKSGRPNKLDGHIVFPICEHDGTLQAWTTRVANDTTKPKCCNASGRKKNWLYGLDRVEIRRNSVFLVEGPLDVLALPRASVALLGKTISTEQIDQLVTNFNRVCICLDSDAGKAAISIAKRLHSRGLTVELCSLESGDPADCVTKDPADLIWRLTKSSVKYDPMQHDERISDLCAIS
jgi:DNA primase